jgi:hypothetical protein
MPTEELLRTFLPTRAEAVELEKRKMAYSTKNGFYSQRSQYLLELRAHRETAEIRKRGSLF